MDEETRKEEPVAPQNVKSPLDKVLEAPEDMLIPFESVTLPSEGLYYDNMVPGGRIEVRPMGMYAEKVLANQRLAKSGKSIDWLIRKCVKFPNPDFDPANLLVGDRVFILYYLRGISYGNEYEFTLTCPNQNCGASNVYVYDLNELASTIVRPNPDLGQEPFKVKLPYFSDFVKEDFWVEVRFMRSYDLQVILDGRADGGRRRAIGHVNAAKTHKGSKQKQQDINFTEVANELVAESVSMLIHSVMGDTDRVSITKIVNKMQSQDTSAIRKFLKDNAPGIDTKIEVTCSKCEQNIIAELPITETFFRPEGT